jgi:hypothetical protein
MISTKRHCEETVGQRSNPGKWLEIATTYLRSLANRRQAILYFKFIIAGGYKII